MQECVDLTYKAFYLAHKYKNPTVLLADGLLAQMMEPVEFGKYPYPEVDNSSWALTGAKGRPSRKIRSYGPTEEGQCIHIEHLFEKYKKIEENEVDFEEYMTEDADLIIVSFGSMSRVVKSAVKECRKKGLKVGAFRPISLYPFPSKRIAELAKSTKKFLVTEINMGQMVRDVRLAVNGAVPVEFLGKPVGAMLHVEDVMNEAERLMV